MNVSRRMSSLDSAYMLATVSYSYINLNRIPDAIPPLQRAAHFAPNDFLARAAQLKNTPPQVAKRNG